MSSAGSGVSLVVVGDDDVTTTTPILSPTGGSTSINDSDRGLLAAASIPPSSGGGGGAPTMPVDGILVGRALVSLVTECQKYYASYYRKSVLWQVVQTVLSLIGSVGTIVVGVLVLVVPGWSTAGGIATVIGGAFSALSSYSVVRTFIQSNDSAGDAFKKLGLSIQYDAVLCASSATVPDLSKYLEELKALIDKYDDPGGMSTERFKWVQDHIEASLSPSPTPVAPAPTAAAAQAPMSSSALAALMDNQRVDRRERDAFQSGW